MADEMKLTPEQHAKVKGFLEAVPQTQEALTEFQRKAELAKARQEIFKAVMDQKKNAHGYGHGPDRSKVQGRRNANKAARKQRRHNRKV